jgi:DNA repair protein RecN (Recombination protein N)
MLTLIRVKNYAVIDEVEVEFEAGLSVMTGETGAGKSILVDALGLALGDRADASAVRAGAERAEINVVFECPQVHPALTWLKEHELDDELSCSIRRLIGTEGRSRAFINNQPVTLADLRTLGGLLVDIHGQHAHQSLLASGVQRDLLDAYADLQPAAAETASRFAAWHSAAAKLEALQTRGEDREAQLELLRFQLSELEDLALNADEPTSLYGERARLGNMDRLVQGLNSALNQLYESDLGSAYSQIVQARQTLAALAEHDAQLTEPAKQLEGVEIELREASSTLLHYRDRLEPDPERLDVIEARLAKIRAMARRHRVDEADLGGVLDTVAARLAELAAGSQSLEALEARVKQAADAYFAAAEALSNDRARAAVVLDREVSAQLKDVGLLHGELRTVIERKPRERADSSGLDRIEMQVQLNPGQGFGLLSKVASGGELSRISLAIEVVATGVSSIPTLVFDEVDAGIGGAVAEIVGRRLKQIAQHRQVLCVTHLAQVASQGAQHYRVVKLTDGASSRTSLRRLTNEERIEELSRMLGGLEITERTRAHAEEMMQGAAK